MKDLYKPYGRESIDPVVLIKMVMIQCSMRQTIKEIEVNFAYQWYFFKKYEHAYNGYYDYNGIVKKSVVM